MSIAITVNIIKIEKNRFLNSDSLITLNMHGDFALFNAEIETHLLSEQRYKFPLPIQNLNNGNIINESPLLLIDGDPNINEIEFGCKIIARYWLDQLGLSYNESDIDLNIINMS